MTVGYHNYCISTQPLRPKYYVVILITVQECVSRHWMQVDP